MRDKFAPLVIYRTFDVQCRPVRVVCVVDIEYFFSFAFTYVKRALAHQRVASLSPWSRAGLMDRATRKSLKSIKLHAWESDGARPIATERNEPGPFFIRLEELARG
jgi:hypothetical protein